MRTHFKTVGLSIEFSGPEMKDHVVLKVWVWFSALSLAAVSAFLSFMMKVCQALGFFITIANV